MITFKPLFKLLSEKNMTVEELAEKSGVSRTIMKRIEKDANVSVAVLARFCQALGCDFKDIMEYVEEDQA